MKIREIITEDCPESDDDSGRTVKNPLPIISNGNDIYFEIIDAAEDMAFEYAARKKEAGEYHPNDLKNYFASAPIMDVPVKKIVGTEPCLDPRGTQSKTQPTLAKFKNVYVIIDGNHRVAKAYVDGIPTIKAHVVDIKPPRTK